MVIKLLWVLARVFREPFIKSSKISELGKKTLNRNSTTSRGEVGKQYHYRLDILPAERLAASSLFGA